MNDADIYKQRAIKQLEQAANNIVKMREARDRQALLPWGWTPTHGELLDRLSNVALGISHQLLAPTRYAYRFIWTLHDTVDNVREVLRLKEDQKGGDK